MGWMNDVFGGAYDNPADSAQPYLDKIPGYVDQYMQPYIDMGMEAGNIAQDQYAKWVTDPYGAYNEAYSNYNQSPYSQYQSDQMHQAATNSAASGGYAGTEYDYQKQMELENALIDNDFSKYMDYILGMQKSGLAGEQQMYNTGYGASSNALATDAAYANASANNQFQGTQAQNQGAAGMLGMLAQAGGLAAGLGMYGPVGGLAAESIMSPSSGYGYGSATKAALPGMMGF